jgi:hypothetical protein
LKALFGDKSVSMTKDNAETKTGEVTIPESMLRFHNHCLQTWMKKEFSP